MRFSYGNYLKFYTTKISYSLHIKNMTENFNLKKETDFKSSESSTGRE